MIIVTRGICFGKGNTIDEAISDWVINYTQEYPLDWELKTTEFNIYRVNKKTPSKQKRLNNKTN